MTRPIPSRPNRTVLGVVSQFEIVSLTSLLGSVFYMLAGSKEDWMATRVKRVNLSVGVWYDNDTDEIKMAIPGEGLTSVKNDPDLKRGHPSLYGKLARALRTAGVEHPPTV